MLDYHSADDMFAALANGKVTVRQVANKVEAILIEEDPERVAAQRATEEEARLRAIEERQRQASKNNRKRRSNCGVIAKGDPDLLVHLARCCNPVAGDDIVGFVTRGKGVSVHRSTCPNVKGLMSDPGRMIDVEWDTFGATEFQVGIVIEASDRLGLLKDVTIAISDSGANILSSSTQVNTQSGIARFRYLVAISDASLLDPLLATVSRVPSVFDARRIMPGEGANQMRKRG